MEVDVERAMDFIAQLGVVIGVIGAGFYGLKKWIKKVAVDPMLQQVAPNGGNQDTTRHLVETMYERQQEFNDTFREHVTASDGRYKEFDDRINKAMALSVEALSVANHTGTRIDMHLERGGHE